MAEAAPYLVAVPAGSNLRTALLNEGWGRRWLTLLRSPKPLLELRRHLRKFLMAELEGDEDPVYFRFYDPEVLRVYMQTCDAAERKPWFDGVVALRVCRSHQRLARDHPLAGLAVRTWASCRSLPRGVWRMRGPRGPRAVTTLSLIHI